MKNKLVVFLPTRKNSERVLNKNTRPFCGIKGGLTALKLRQLLAANSISDIVLSTNDPECVRIAESFNSEKITIDIRPENLCQSDTPLSDLIKYVPQIIDSEHILWTHTTSPFINSKDYDNAISKYFENTEKDSLVSVVKIQQFLWDSALNKPLNFNFDKGEWPRTQDLDCYYELNSGIFINSRANYIRYNNRITSNLIFFELNKIQQVDIDREEDFTFAEMLFKCLNNPL